MSSLVKRKRAARERDREKAIVGKRQRGGGLEEQAEMLRHPLLRMILPVAMTLI